MTKLAVMCCAAESAAVMCCRTTHVLAGAKMNELKARNNWSL
jgi:hypothetical protein